MAHRIISISNNFIKSFNNLHINKLNVSSTATSLLENHVPVISSIRNTSFYTKCKFYNLILLSTNF